MTWPKPNLVISLAALVVVILTSGLGVWQLDRAAQKQALARTMRDRAALPPLNAPPSLGDAAAPTLWHVPIAVRGRWMAQHTLYLDNRQKLDRGQARVGFDVVTPLMLADGSAVLVQRGWMARNFLDRVRVGDVPTPEGWVLVQGRYAPPPPRLFEFKTDQSLLGRVRQNVDVDAFAQEIGVKLRPGSILQGGDDAASSVLSRAWSLPDVGVARHHGYAFQWFGLSALFAGLYVWFQIVRPWLRRRNTLSSRQPL